jgi:hypothetical protein
MHFSFGPSQIAHKNNLNFNQFLSVLKFTFFSEFSLHFSSPDNGNLRIPVFTMFWFRQFKEMPVVFLLHSMFVLIKSVSAFTLLLYSNMHI